MPKYSVQVPISGYVTVKVEAADETEAATKALEVPVTRDDIEEWDTHDAITKGNISYATLNEIHVEQIDD